MLSPQDMADLREAEKLGLISPDLLEQLVEGERGRAREAAAQAMALQVQAANDRKQAVSVENLRFYEAIARREVEVARLNGDEPEIRRATLVLDHFGRRIAEAVDQRVAVKPPQATRPPRKIEAPSEALEPLGLVRELRRLGNGLQEVATSCRVFPRTPIGELDAELCLAWTNEESTPEEWHRSAASRLLGLKSYEAGRLLSARNAEKAAMRYYENLGARVEDVSASQLSPGDSSWKDFDIRTDDQCVDVKNARESLHGDGHYVEHTVPRFKLDRASGKQVSIAAVVSPYIVDLESFFGAPQQATVLGEVDSAQIRSLLEWTRVRFGDKLEVRDPTRAGFLPGWLFEFPSAHYPHREASIAAAPGFIGQLLEAFAYSCEIPAWLWVFSGAPIPKGLPAAAVLADLRSLHGSIGLSRRALYVLALGLALEELRGQDGEESQLSTLMDACRMSGNGDRRHLNVRPLGLDDPLAYVHNLIATLTEIVSTLRRMQIEIVGFRLAHPAILQGLRATGERMTLLAYCGGWQRRPKLARCGKSPLSIARHATCPSCSHLVCDNCGHCSDLCGDCQQRQSSVIEEFDRAARLRAKAESGGRVGDWDDAWG